MRYAWLDTQRGYYSVSWLCRVLAVSSSGYCQWRVRQSLVRQGLAPVDKRRLRITTDSDHALPIAANLLARKLHGWAPNRAWVGD